MDSNDINWIVIVLFISYIIKRIKSHSIANCDMKNIIYQEISEMFVVLYQLKYCNIVSFWWKRNIIFMYTDVCIAWLLSESAYHIHLTCYALPLPSTRILSVRRIAHTMATNHVEHAIFLSHILRTTKLWCIAFSLLMLKQSLQTEYINI